jgi:hypothetical protein
MVRLEGLGPPTREPGMRPDAILAAGRENPLEGRFGQGRLRSYRSYDLILYWVGASTLDRAALGGR